MNLDRFQNPDAGDRNQFSEYGDELRERRASEPTGVDRFWRDTAYFAALVVYLIEHKNDTEADAEIADILKARPFMESVLFDTLNHL